MSTKNNQLPLIVFAVTFFIGIVAIIISFQSQKLIPQIFQQTGVYPSSGGNCTPGDNCSGCDGAGSWYNCRCQGGASDPWCCDGTDRSPQPSPSGSTAPTPSPASFTCLSLGPQPQSPAPGKQFTFTCNSTSANTRVNHYNFRVNSETLTKVPAPSANPSQATFSYTIPQTGTDFTVQCQVCVSTDDSFCTTWGKAF